VTTSTTERLPVDDLRTLFLFEHLDEDQLRWLSDHGEILRVPAGSAVYREGEPATCLYVLLDGTLSMTGRIGGEDVEIRRTNDRGVYGGALQAYIGDRVDQSYRNSFLAVTDCTLFTLPAEVFASLMREWFPMALHLLEGLFFGMRDTQKITSQRERLLALGSLTAGLTHELNNPAAAAQRATAALRERVGDMRHKLAMLASGRVDAEQMRLLTDLQQAAVEKAAATPDLSPLEASDAEDELADWFADHGVNNGWSIAPTFVAVGLGVDFANRIADKVDPDFWDSAFRWLAHTLEVEALLNEIADATGRISDLVGAAKNYSQLDRAPYQRVDLHDGLDSTVVMLAHRIGPGVEVVKDYDRTLPLVPSYPAELNQVWTNLIDNALSAMGDSGTLTLRTRRQDANAVVEVIDTGAGIPDDSVSRVFEPFFTTKPVGEGTGLGLDISFKIVVNRHHGDIRVHSEPGDTTFEVRLPLNPPAADSVPVDEPGSPDGNQSAFTSGETP
jgi:signal transduction histidine kinase